MRKPEVLRRLCALVVALAATAAAPLVASAESAGPQPAYQTLGELSGKRFAYVNGSVYNQAVEAKVKGTTEQYYASLADCVAAVEADKADAAVQLSYCCQLAVNRRDGAVTLLPETVGDVEEAFFFPHGDPLVERFNEVIDRLERDGTIDRLTEKWVSADDTGKTLPEQDRDAPNGTLRFATSGVLEPFSYVGDDNVALGYDVDLALCIAKELGYHLEVTTIPMDAIFASVESGKVDFGGTLTKTDERAKTVDFTKRVMPTTISVIVKASEGGPQLEYTSIDALAGARLGDINGSVITDLASQVISGIDRDAVTYFNSLSEEIAALKAGKIDAFLNDEPVARLAVNRNEGIGIIPEELITSEYAFFFKKGSELTEQFNTVFEKLENDGTLERLKAKWTSADDAAKTIPEQDWEAPHGTLTMATMGTQEPMTYYVGDALVGYDVEVALLACKELGYRLEASSMDLAGMMAAVEGGKADFGCGGITVSEERAQRVDFTRPNYHGSVVAVVRASAGAAGGGSPVANLIDSIGRSLHKTFVEEGRWRLILSGLGVTVLISVCAGALGTLLGYGMVLVRRGGRRWATRLVDGYQALMGGVPLVVVLMVLYYVVFGSLDIPGALVAILAFTLAFGSTAGSTMWTAIAGIDTIQEETGLALGYTRAEVFRKIIFPQARQQFMPQLAGQFVSLVKDTAIVGYIAVQDLTRASDLIRSRTMDAFFPLLSTAVIYFVLCRILAWALARLTARLDVTSRPRTIKGVEQ